MESSNRVKNCFAWYNTEITVIAALASAAIRKDRVHDIILMVEMGDLREGILPENLAEIARQVIKMPGVALKGIGANFACLNGIAPSASQMATLCDLANEIEGACGPFLQTVSGGNSANLPWALGSQNTGRINDLRLGEAILLGVEPVSGAQIGEMHKDAFTLVAEVIEAGAKSASLSNTLLDPSLAQLRIVTTSGDSTHQILAIGHQDTDISGLSMPVGSSLIGATSDHPVIESIRSPLRVGSEGRFQMNYSALMHAMAAPDIKVKLLHDRLTRQPRHAQGKSEHLALV